MSDDLPLQRFADGDIADETFEAAVPELIKLIRGYLTWFGAVPERLEDLAQEAIVKVYMYRGRRQATGLPALKGWMRVLCRNLVADSARDARPGVAGFAAEQIEDPPRDLDLREVLDVCISRLREPDRTVFLLRYDSGWSTAGIAELFGWKPRNCELILARARRALSRCIQRSGGVLRVAGERKSP